MHHSSGALENREADVWYRAFSTVCEPQTLWKTQTWNKLEKSIAWGLKLTHEKKIQDDVKLRSVYRMFAFELS